MLAEFGQGLRSVLVEAGEHGECRVPEAAFGALAAEAAVEASDGGAQLPAQVGLLGLLGLLGVGGLLFSCVFLHSYLIYLNKFLSYT
jgi:hypothetical protein